jgi:hypothetical protein
MTVSHDILAVKTDDIVSDVTSRIMHKICQYNMSVHKLLPCFKIFSRKKSPILNYCKKLTQSRSSKMAKVDNYFAGNY